MRDLALEKRTGGIPLPLRLRPGMRCAICGCMPGLTMSAVVRATGPLTQLRTGSVMVTIHRCESAYCSARAEQLSNEAAS